MQKILIGLALIAPLLATTANAAETNMRAGLWQITTTSDLLRIVPHLPPEQMQSIKDLAKDYGLDMPQIENGAAISQTCITQEMANQKTLPNFYQTQLGCTSKNATRSGNNYKIDFVCASPDLKGMGTAEGAITNPENFTGQTNFSGEAQGTPVNERADINGKWLNASCGAVKPL
ncbi:MAG: DUF3617 domain-containing protein [Methylotenera sp.]|nr:DUF3617 domain-containing protein [Methylotenera sp.]